MSDTSQLPVPIEEVEATPVEQPSVGELIRQMPAPVVAAGAGFVAGVVTFTLVRVLKALRHPSRLLPARRRAAKIDVKATRSFLVDVHLLNKR
jgi:hypothetical protein